MPRVAQPLFGVSAGQHYLPRLLIEAQQKAIRLNQARKMNGLLVAVIKVNGLAHQGFVG